jgi:hypothetical protein
MESCEAETSKLDASQHHYGSHCQFSTKHIFSRMVLTRSDEKTLDMTTQSLTCSLSLNKLEHALCIEPSQQISYTNIAVATLNNCTQDTQVYYLLYFCLLKAPLNPPYVLTLLLNILSISAASRTALCSSFSLDATSCTAFCSSVSI